MNALSVHVVLADGSEFESVSACVRRRIRGQFKISHVTIQVERAGCADVEVHL
jgi:Co/Zn/Cd efflux system component